MLRNLINLFFGVFFIGFSSFSLHGQTIVGQWNGKLNVNGMGLRIVFHIDKDGTDYTATMDSPDQGAKGIPMSSASFSKDTLQLALAAAGIKYTGLYQNDSVVGTFTQNGIHFPLTLKKGETAQSATQRPQEPQPPFPYKSEELTIENKQADVTLSGTLTLPKSKGKFPLAILISGSGPQNRDEELVGHKPFLVLSDYLTREGIAVFRYDDRGVGKSTGNFEAATTADFSTDVEAIVEQLKKHKNIDPSRIGLIGHSEGGIVAPMVASRNSGIHFIVLMAGTGIVGSELLLLQQALVAQAEGVSDNEIESSKNLMQEAYGLISETSNEEELEDRLTRYFLTALEENENEIPNDFTKENYTELLVRQLNTPWMRYFVTYDPYPALTQVHCKVLAINGSTDLQVPSEVNLRAIESALSKAGNKHYTIKELDNLNHLFQKSGSGAPSEYARIEETISPLALKTIGDWLRQNVID